MAFSSKAHTVKAKSIPAVLAVVLAVLAGLAPLGAQVKPAVTNDSYTLDLLRRTIEAQKKNPDKVVRAPETGKAPGTNSPEVVELENQYIQGKISAKQFQRELERIQFEKEQREKAGLPPLPKTAATPALSPKAATAAGLTGATPQPAFATPPPQVNPNQKKLSEVEIKIEEMMQKRLEREKAAKEAASAAALTNNPSGAPPTKRQRLDALLRQVVEGKMNDADYRVQREKIMAEPN
jgi:hypothetical protein